MVGRCAGRSRRPTRRACGDLRLVLGGSGDHERHAVRQRLLDAAVAAIGDHDVCAWKQFVIGHEVDEARIVGKAVSEGRPYVLGVAATCRCDDVDVFVGK